MPEPKLIVERWRQRVDWLLAARASWCGVLVDDAVETWAAILSLWDDGWTPVLFEVPDSITPRQRQRAASLWACLAPAKRPQGFVVSPLREGETRAGALLRGCLAYGVRHAWLSPHAVLRPDPRGTDLARVKLVRCACSAGVLLRLFAGDLMAEAARRERITRHSGSPSPEPGERQAPAGNDAGNEAENDAANDPQTDPGTTPSPERMLRRLAQQAAAAERVHSLDGAHFTARALHTGAPLFAARRCTWRACDHNCRACLEYDSGLLDLWDEWHAEFERRPATRGLLDSLA